VLFAQAMAQAAHAADLIVIAGPDLAQAVAALFAAGAVTDLAPYLGESRATASGGTLASRTVPQMRPAEPLAPAQAPG